MIKATPILLTPQRRAEIADPLRPKFLGYRASGIDGHHLRIDDDHWDSEWFPINATVLILGPTREVISIGEAMFQYRVRICGIELWLHHSFISLEPT